MTITCIATMIFAFYASVVIASSCIHADLKALNISVYANADIAGEEAHHHTRAWLCESVHKQVLASVAVPNDATSISSFPPLLIEIHNALSVNERRLDENHPPGFHFSAPKNNSQLPSILRI